MKIKLFVSDIDGTLTDSCMYVSDKGEELKKFSHRDGRGFHLLRELTNIKTMWVTSEKGGINKARADKLIKLGTLDYFVDGSWGMGKVEKIKDVCKKLNIKLDEVAFIGDDTNDLEALTSVGLMGCPFDSHIDIRSLLGMNIMDNNGGQGAVREFIDMIIKDELCELK
jgi:N-acylneuraminate cytidylyltransferase